MTKLEGSESIENEGFEGNARPESFMEEQAVAAHAFSQAHDGRVGAPELPGDLAEGGTAERAVEDRNEEFGMSQPVGGGEGL